MGLKSAMLMAGCLSSATVAAAAASDRQRTTQTRFLRKRQGGKVGRKLMNSKPQQRKTTQNKHDDLDITAEDVGFWTRSLQSSLPPVPTTPAPTDPPVTPPTNPPVPFTPAPVATDLPTIIEDTPAPTLVQFVPTPAPTTLEPTENPTISPTFACNLTPDERATSIRELMETVSDPSSFDDPSSPQSLALDWITNVDEPADGTLCPNQVNPNGCTRGGQINSMIQRYILAVFYYATEGDDWDQCSAPEDLESEASIDAANAECGRVVTPFGVSNQRRGDTSTDAWLTPGNECEWGGVACWGADTANLNWCVDQIDFENDGLSGELVPELGVLSSMRFLILEQGTISGPIPPEYGDLQRLLILDMDFNQLTGSLPDTLYDLSSLQQLDLNDNQLTGSISPRIGDLSLLTFFQIDHNELSNTIPSEMGQLSNLRIAFLSVNDIVGSMPEEVCALRNNTSPPGVLGVLVTDCATNEPFEPVDCPCCSSCA